MSHSALDCALALAADFGVACFPCGASKRPTTPNGLYDASKNGPELRALWRDHPGPLIGVACGEASNLALLDLDSKHLTAKKMVG
jgi:Bifunctional DNA primase/polymerase, N-terminal